MVVKSHISNDSKLQLIIHKDHPLSQRILIDNRGIMAGKIKKINHLTDMQITKFSKGSKNIN